MAGVGDGDQGETAEPELSPDITDAQMRERLLQLHGPMIRKDNDDAKAFDALTPRQVWLVFRMVGHSWHFGHRKGGYDAVAKHSGVPTE